MNDGGSFIRDGQQQSSLSRKAESTGEARQSIVRLAAWTTKVEFGQPDALRNCKIQASGRVLYVCEFYLSIWSTLFRRHFESESDKSTLLLNKSYGAIVEFLQCIYPTQKKVNGDNLKLLLETASDFESEGMLVKCMDYMRRGCPLSLMERLELADRYRLEPLLSELIVNFSTQPTLNLESAHYLNVSDHTKVRLLENLYRKASSSKGYSATNDATSNEKTTGRFDLKSDLNFTALRTQGSRVFYINPYYVAAWSQLAFDTVVSMTTIESLSLAVSDDEAEAFLFAVYPPMEPCTDRNASVRLRAACSLRSPGLLCLTVDYVLNESANLNTGEKLLMLDGCKLHDVMPTCLLEVANTHDLIDLITRPVYEALSSQAKACILDRLVFLLKHGQDAAIV
ncbi:BTB/POZ domain protein [Trichuris suis]|nr:BTB/POZ domain protein [Trichuris suis]